MSVDFLTLIISTIFGFLIGSFLNVVVLRHQTGMGLSGRSQCFSCNKPLRWFELVPVFSYLLQRGRCRRCKSTVSWQYPIVELLTGAVTGLIVMAQGLSFVGALYLLAAWVLIAITVYDIKHFIIPDRWTILIGVIGLAGQISGILPVVPAAFGWVDLLAGLFFAIPFALLWLLSKGRLMGLGDPKLMLSLGLLLGFWSGLSALASAFWIGSIVSIVFVLVSRARRRGKVTMQTAVPFGPFLALGAILHMILPVPILSLFF